MAFLTVFVQLYFCKCQNTFEANFIDLLLKIEDVQSQNNPEDLTRISPDREQPDGMLV